MIENLHNPPDLQLFKKIFFASFPAKLVALWHKHDGNFQRPAVEYYFLGLISFPTT